MARPVWRGSISFGLVNVPVKAFTAVRDHDVHFHRVEKGTGARVRNRTVSEKTGDEVTASVKSAKAGRKQASTRKRSAARRSA